MPLVWCLRMKCWDYFCFILKYSFPRLLLFHSTKQTPWRRYRTCQRSIPWSITRLPPSSPSSSLTWESSPRRLSAMNSSSFIYNCASPFSIKMHRQNKVQGVGFNWMLTKLNTAVGSCVVLRAAVWQSCFVFRLRLVCYLFLKVLLADLPFLEFLEEASVI